MPAETNQTLSRRQMLNQSGLGLGSVALPRMVPRSWHPLRVYAGLELSISVIGLILLVALPRVQTVYLAAVGYGLDGVLLRAVVCIACLLPPTMLMGATLPAVARWTGVTRTGVAQTGLLYAANTIGAVAGVLIASFYLLRLHDTVVTTLVAVGLNVAVALVALLISIEPLIDMARTALNVSGSMTAGVLTSRVLEMPESAPLEQTS